jgi:hypothetical protein
LQQYLPTGEIEGLARRSPTEALPYHRRAVVPRVSSSTSVFTGPAWLLVHAQLAASVRIKSAALPTNAGEKNEPTGGVAESIGSLNDLIQLAEGRRLGFVHASSAGRERSPFCSY